MEQLFTFNRVLGKLITFVPRSRLLYHAAKHYVDRYNNDNNSSLRKNGEMHWLREVLGLCSVVFDV